MQKGRQRKKGAAAAYGCIAASVVGDWPAVPAVKSSSP